jgi:hypothetical protein
VTDAYQGTIQSALNQSNPNQLPDLLQKVQVGDMLANIKAVATSLTAAGSFDITTAAFYAKCTVTGLNTLGGDRATLPPVGVLRTLRVTAATTASTVGTYILTDVAGDMITAATHTVVGVARISDDGKTISFPTTDVTAFIIEYAARAAVDPTTNYPANT